MRLYFLRHGKTEWNLESRFQGAGGDSPLLPESSAQIQAAAVFLNQETFQHVFASPIKRARDTAIGVIQLLNQQPALTLLSRLEEFRLGRWEGMLLEEAQMKYPAEFKAFKNAPADYNPVRLGGESFQELIARTTPAITRMVSAYPNPDDNVLVVGHGAALSAEINSLLGSPIAHLRDRGGLSNTSTTILETLDKGKSYQLLDWNNSSYLSGERHVTDTV